MTRAGEATILFSLREQYETKKAADKARQEEQQRAAYEADIAKISFWRQPDGIVRYTGWLSLYTLALFFATLLLFGATVISTIILHNTDEKVGVQAEATNRLAKNAGNQVAVMQGQLKEMQAAQRPWVYAADIVPAGHIVLEAGQYILPLRFSIKNTGHLPAFSVEPKTSAAILTIGGRSSMTIKNNVCDAYREGPLTKTGATVFAGQTLTHGGFTGDDYPRVSKMAWDAISGDKLMVMFGCIDYQFPAEPGHHQSRFSFAVGVLKNQGILERIGSLRAGPGNLHRAISGVSA
jgi:hypothetical protein